MWRAKFLSSAPRLTKSCQSSLRRHSLEICWKIRARGMTMTTWEKPSHNSLYLPSYCSWMSLHYAFTSPMSRPSFPSPSPLLSPSPSLSSISISTSTSRQRQELVLEDRCRPEMSWSSKFQTLPLKLQNLRSTAQKQRGPTELRLGLGSGRGARMKANVRYASSSAGSATRCVLPIG